MSFSSEVKEELSRQINSARHCEIAELAAILWLCGKIIHMDNDRALIQIHTENISVAKKCFTLLKEIFPDIEIDISIKRNAYLKKSRIYTISIYQMSDIIKVLKSTKYAINGDNIPQDFARLNKIIIQNECCKRAFLRGAFLAIGSISDPEKFYHLELSCSSLEKAEQLRDIINVFPLDSKIVTRKKYYVIYIKEGDKIVHMLSLMQAPQSLMKLENVRIKKEIRNTINRNVNCETANIAKTVSAAIEQIHDIVYIRDTIGLDGLPEGLEEIAKARLSQPQATLQELGESLESPVGKSGVNHRLRKIKNLADSLRKGRENRLN